MAAGRGVNFTMSIGYLSTGSFIVHVRFCRILVFRFTVNFLKSLAAKQSVEGCFIGVFIDFNSL